MTISVIIPTYNRANFIIKTVESVLNQTIQPSEIIIVDDGSRDNTEQILNNWQYFDKIIYIKQDNQGVSSARNVGIKLAKNQWICFLDSDDIWHTNKLEKQIDFHKKNSHILFSHTNEKWLFNGKLIRQKKHQQKVSGFCFVKNIKNTLIGASTVMIHKTIFDEVGIFDENLQVCEDYDLWLRILKHYELGLIKDELIDKIAGHKNQLSFETPLMDTYRIEALIKHIDTKYKTDIIAIIRQKCDILINGAIKYNNKKIVDKYKDLKLFIS